MRFMFLDFEFNGISEAKYNLISVSVRCTDAGVTTFERDYWLLDAAERAEAIKFFRKLLPEYILVAYALEVEIRSLISLLPDFNWLKTVQGVDLYVEYRLLLNRNNSLSYGEQLIDGKIVTTTPPPSKWEKEEFDPEDYTEKKEDPHHKPSFSLAAACFKLLGVVIDTKEKNEVRDIIIQGNPEKIEAARERIQAYNKSDIAHLPKLLGRMATVNIATATGTQPKNVKKQEAEAWVRGAMFRGVYSVRTARMTYAGYPVNHEKLKLFRENVKGILEEAVKDCLEADPSVKAFRFDKKKEKWICNTKEIQAWIAAQNFPRWRQTNKKAISVSKDAFGDWFNGQSEGFPGAFCRYLKTKQSLNGFVPSESGKKGVFSDFVGSDGRVRPYFGIYGSQTSRSQPGSVGFIPLKAHWMRNFIEAPPGFALCSLDYASQEFLIAAIISQDKKMMQSYASGDVYLAFGKAAKLIPEEGTKESHKVMRDVCKTLVLGIGFDMSARGLAPRLERVLKTPITEDYAQDLIDTYYETYDTFAEWKQETLSEYRSEQYLMLPDSWVMWGDNDNHRSVGNFLIQGHGAVIMREAVRRAQDRGLRVIYTLHDSLTIEFPSQYFDKILDLKASMLSAFEDVMGQYGKTIPIRLDGEAWSQDYKTVKPTALEGVKYLTEYEDEKGAADLKRYRKFFDSELLKDAIPVETRPLSTSPAGVVAEEPCHT